MKKYLDIIYYNRKEIIIVIIILLGFLSLNFLNKKEEPKIIENTTEEKEEIDTIVIDIKGEVNNPGSYEIENGKRIKDAIEKAGGLKSTANIENINLSEKLQDEMLIIIPNNEEQIQEKQENKYEVKDSKISINNATANELTAISGLGKSKAQSIVEYRNKNGKFNKLEDITKVSGIGIKTFEKIKNYIKL